jgi:hypothetical protein
MLALDTVPEKTSINKLLESFIFRHVDPFNLAVSASVVSASKEDICLRTQKRAMFYNIPSELSLQTKQMYSTQTSQQSQLHIQANAFPPPSEYNEN